MALPRADRPSRATVGLATATALAGVVALVCVFIGVAYGLGWLRAGVVFVMTAIVVGVGMYTWHRFTSRLR